ncbi:class I histocompatibility antigen, F10 alpha chain-like [Chanodichthys erythropterus]|uniref:class I histocompatibility antigen, F10 alpha chain-like n=1 Tax=Chanodichthys erythropterus TaxID=933992 RepID=UPI00351F278D
MQSAVFLFFGIHLVYAGKHSLQYFFTATSGLPNFPKFVSVGLVDGQPFTYYDSNIRREIPRQEWMAKSEGEEYWDRETQTSNRAEQRFMNSIEVAKYRFNQTGGVHTFQEMYGCEWDDQTGETNAFRLEGYDGDDFLSEDLKEMRYISPVLQGFPTAQKWNNDKALIDNDKNYFSTECIEWLQKYLQYGKNSLQKTVSPQVSLLQKDPSSPVTCHATGFYPSGVTITWMKNGQDHHEDVELGELLPNEDGTFQRTSTLRVTPDEWKNNEFSCVVEHRGETIRGILPDNSSDSFPIGIIVGVVVALILLIVSGVVGFVLYRRKKGFKPVPQNQSDDGSNRS